MLSATLEEQTLPLSIPGLTMPALKVTLTGAPAGGTYSVTLTASGIPATAVTVSIAFNDTAVNIAAKLAAAASTVFLVGYNMFPFGGPLPGEAGVLFGGNLQDTEWRVTSTTNSLTGGTSPNAVISTVHTLPGREWSGDRGFVVYDGTTAPNSTSGTPAPETIPNQKGGPTGSFCWFNQGLNSSNEGQTAIASFTMPYALDLTETSVHMDVFNPHEGPINVGFVGHAGTVGTWTPYTLHPGWNTISTELGHRTGTQSQGAEPSNVTTIGIRVGGIVSEQGADVTQVRLGIGEIRLFHGEVPRLAVLVDDCADNSFTFWRQVAKEFPWLKIGFGVISDLIGTANYITEPQLKTLHDDPQFFIFNHTKDHGNRISGSTQNYETGINPARVGQATGTSFIVRYKSGSAPSSGTFTLTFAGGTTAGLAWNGSLDTIAPAIKAVQSDATVTMEDWGGGQLVAGNALRITTQNPIALPTISNTTNYEIGWTYTIGDIENAYSGCMSYMARTGVIDESNLQITASPLGSFGQATRTAQRNVGMLFTFQAQRTRNRNTSSLHEMCNVANYAIPRIDINDVTQRGPAIGSMLVYGGVLFLMGHNMTESATSTGSQILNRTDAQVLFRALGRLVGKGFLMTTPLTEVKRAKEVYGKIVSRGPGEIG